MQAMMMRQPGPPEVLQQVELDPPTITQPNQVLVRLHAAGVNPIDTKIRARGTLLPDTLTAVLGCDGAGVVEAVGEQVSHVRPGEAVWFCYGGLGGLVGNYAEWIVVDQAAVQPLPAGLDWISAAAAPLVLITAWEALHDRARIAPGQRVLIHGGAGGVGHVAIQLAVAAGARVATTVSSAAKADFVHTLGAECAINYREESLPEAIADWSEGQGVDIALDTIGASVLPTTFAAMRPYADVVTLLDPGPELELREARVRNLRLSLELMLTPQLRGLPDALAHQGHILQQCAALIEQRKLQITVADTFPLNQAVAAHRRLESGGLQGKLVLTIPE